MKKGFTLMELIIVVVIIGILAMVGLPQFFKVAERGRASEAFATLGALRSAQIRYATENPNSTTASNISNLDVDIPSDTLKYFNAPTVAAVQNPTTTNSNTTVATIQRSDSSNNYICTITGGGRIACTGGTNRPPDPQ